MVQIAVKRIQISNRIGHVKRHAGLRFIELIVLLVPDPQNGRIHDDGGMLGGIGWNLGNIKVRGYEAVWQCQFQVLVKITILPTLQ